jgi:D-alanine-D-alanine ligase
MNPNVRVTVLRGGPSAEREVSLASGEAVASACRRLGYSVLESDISPTDLRALDHATDVVFPVLHGYFGEDGQFQAILESRGLSYIGSDAAASRRMINKAVAKQTWHDAGLPTAPWFMVDSLPVSSQLPDHLRPPVVVKPVAEGSSIGVSLCHTVDDFHQSLTKTVQTYGNVLIEKCLSGPELTVGILGNTVLPIIQIKPTAGFYDYNAKYSRNDTTYLFEPEIDRHTYAIVQDLAIRAFHVSGCRDFARVDVIVDKTTGPQLLEINTIPGFTSHSLMPKAAAQAGIVFDKLVEQLVRMALLRKR